jgi:tetratricopeptide (TPR) repeat protein
LIPPGAADVGHYRLSVPRTTGSLKVIASVQYRKFDWWHNQFTYAGVPDPDDREAEVTVDFDDRAFVFTGSTDDVSGDLKQIPDLPIVTMASDTTILHVGRIIDSADIATQPEDRVRWNDYGIALMREGDLKGAERAFQKVVEVDSDYTDGWVNLARVYLREGDLDAAEEMIHESESVHPGFYKARYFRALISKSRGHYEEALEDLHSVARRFPRDRVVLGEIGRVYFLNSHLREAAGSFEEVLQIDPEDLGAHYNLMLIYRALGDDDLANQHQQRYQRFKADEEAPSIAQKYRQLNPFDNNEALAVHEHTSGD